MNEYTFDTSELEQVLNKNERIRPEIERHLKTSISFLNTPDMMAIQFPAKHFYNTLAQEQIDAFWERLVTIVYHYTRKSLSKHLCQ